MINNIWSIETGFFKLDGGAMFGVVPKTLWNKWNPSDSNNRCSWAMRSLLIQLGEKLILIDTGCGNKQDFSHYDLHGEASLKKSLQELTFDEKDITDVILTHLHFDHVGGSTLKDENGQLRPSFPNAQYWISNTQWLWANADQIRERSSFLKENFMPLYDANVLQLVSYMKAPFGNEIKLHEMMGHTRGMWVAEILYKNKKIYFVSDLIPSIHHIPIPYVMSYDIEPLKAMDEKKHVLEKALNEDALLFFQHDPVNECCSLMMTDRGIRPNKVGMLHALLEE